MSEWRSRAFYLTRSRPFLLRVAFVIVGVCTLIALGILIVQGKPETPRVPRLTAQSVIASQQKVFIEEYELLAKAPTKQPERLTRWLLDLDFQRNSAKDPEKFDSAGLRYGPLDLEGVCRKHAVDDAQYEAFAAYARHQLDEDKAAQQQALAQLEKICTRESPPRHANELLAEAFGALDRDKDALAAWMREGKHPESKEARRMAFATALSLKDTASLRAMCDDRTLRREISPFALREAAIILNDTNLRFEAMIRLFWENWLQFRYVLMTLLAAGIWYGILVYSASRERYRFLRYLPAVFAGVVSVMLLLWAMETIDYKTPEEGKAPTQTHAMMDWVLNVGLPEEVVKMLMFAFFLPVLLHRGSAVKAALTGGCVGLGFALEENIGYFHASGGAAALGRFLTANFMHISLTGILGWGLYGLFRTRFHKATEFLIVFVGVVAAHGLYDFSLTLAGDDWGQDIMATVILAACAKYYLGLLHSPSEKPGGWVFSRTSIFIWGVSLLVGVLVINAAWQTRALAGITDTLRVALSGAVVAFIFLREFREV